MSRRIPGEFVPSDVNLANDPSIMRAGPLAELLFRRANEYAKKCARDGEIYSLELGIIAHGIPGKAEALAANLVREGLWEAMGDGWLIRSFLKWNLSQEEQRDEREKKRLAAQLTNHKRYHTDDPQPDCQHCNKETK